MECLLIRPFGEIAAEPRQASLIWNGQMGIAFDYSVFYEGQRVGRIYRMQSTDRELWYWTEIGARAPNSGLADTLEAAETDFHSAWEMQR